MIHLDAGVVIGFLDGDDTHHQSARRVLEAALADGHDLAMAAPAYAECLVGPARLGESAIATAVEFFGRLPIKVLPATGDVAVLAARLRARHLSLRLPDTLVIATAQHFAAHELVTTDRRWPARDALGLDAALTTI